jgi:parvulin-like peptidyl-prolyl isomerase
LLVVVTLVAAACGGGNDPLAVVNGEEITIDDMVALNPMYEVIDEFEQDRFVDDLGLLVLLSAIENTAGGDFGVDVSDADVEAFITNPPAERAGIIATWQGNVAEGGMTEGQLRLNVRSLLVRDAVTAELFEDADAINDLWEQTPQLFASACVRHILTQFEDEAISASERIAAGEGFAAVADEVSRDTSTQGGLLADPETGECDVPLEVFVPEFGYEAALAPIGEVTGPFVSDFGWHIILVEERTIPSSLAEVQANLDAYVSDSVRSQLVTPWINDAIDTAEIEIDPSIGTWSQTGSAILPAGEGDQSEIVEPSESE